MLLLLADVYLSAHAAGGMEAAMVNKPHPEGVAETGVRFESLAHERQWGFGATFDRVERGYDGIDSEYKLDFGIVFADEDHKARGLVGMGVRSLTLTGEDIQRSTIPGVDLVRLDQALQIARIGPVSLDFYVSWTFGIYKGEVYEPRYGDMPVTSHEVTKLTTAYVFGLQTSVAFEK